MLPILNNLESLRTGSSQRRCVLLRITRTDGTIFRFTDHNTSLEFQGETFEPRGSFATSAEDRASGLRERSIDAVGVVDSDKITDVDLHKGLFNDALIERWVVDWQYPWAGAFLYQKWWIDQLEFTVERWKGTLIGWLGRIQRTAGHTVQRVCRHSFGDSGCSKDLTSLTLTGQAVSEVGGNTYVSFKSSDLDAETDHKYRFGKLTWTSGGNTGRSVEVKDNVLDTHMQITLQLEMPVPVEVGDEFTIVAGCDGLFSTCKTYSNQINFGGQHTVPGNNKVINPAG